MSIARAMRTIRLIPLGLMALLVAAPSISAAPVQDVYDLANPALDTAASRCPMGPTPVERQYAALYAVGGGRTIGPIAPPIEEVPAVPVPTIPTIDPPVDEVPSVPLPVPPVGPVSPPGGTPAIPIEPVTVDPPVEQVGPIPVPVPPIGPVTTPGVDLPRYRDMDAVAGTDPRGECEHLAQDVKDRERLIQSRDAEEDGSDEGSSGESGASA